jgi:cellulose synthase operon protein C
VLAQVYTELGEPHVALGQLDALLAQVTDVERLAYRAQLLQRSGELLWSLDRDEEAAERFDAAARAYGQADLPLETVHARRRQMLALHHARRHDEAMATLFQLEELIAVTEVPAGQQATFVFERALLGYEAVQVLNNHGDPDPAGALARIAPVAALFRSIDATEQAMLAELRHGQVLVVAGQPAQAVTLLQRLIELWPDEHGARAENAAWLARALDETGEHRQARKLRKQYNLPAPE